MAKHVYSRRTMLAIPAGIVTAGAARLLSQNILGYPPPTATCLGSTSTTITLQICGGTRPSGPTGAPNGIDIVWQTQANLQANNGQFNLGDPEVFGATLTTPLSAGQCVSVVIGGSQPGLAYEPGDNILLDCGTTYVFRLQARRDPVPGIYQSDFARVTCTTGPCVGCGTLTQGYWKNHPSVWPLQSLTLGTTTYSQAQLLQIFRTPVAGNGLISLAHQLIAAKLNVANQAGCAAATTAITAADTLIGNLVVPPVGSGYLAPKLTSALVGQLDTYNKGQAAGCPTHCK